MKKTKKILLALGCIAVLFTGCANENAIATNEEIAVPTSITIYDKGEKVELTSAEEKFNKIYEENKARTTAINDALNTAVDDEKFKLFKDEGISVSFKYDKEQILKYTDKNGKEKEVLYTELFFPLSDGALAKDKDDSTTVIAVGKSSKEILTELSAPEKVLEYLNDGQGE